MIAPQTARIRARIIAEIRRFLTTEGYLEVETPILSPALIPERSIEVFATRYRNPFAADRSLYLIPSPEVWMKRLLAAGWPSLFQITKAFRNGESVGREHNPEFTILEYYAVEADYEDTFAVTGRLLSQLCSLDETVSLVSEPSELSRLSVQEAFERYAGIDLEAHLTVEGLRHALAERRMQYGEEDDVEALFNRLFVHLVEPRLAEYPAVALFDYPHAVPTTARRKSDTPWSERWELYLGGVEVANCYSEETDPEEVDRYFESETPAKQSALEPHPPDAGYREIFRQGFPRSSGVALGVDRLVQVLLGLGSIEGVILFPLSSIFR